MGSQLPDWCQEICAPDGRRIFVKSSSDNSLPDHPDAGPSRRELRAEYLLLGRLRGGAWQKPLAYYRFTHTDCMLTEAASGRPLTDLGQLPLEMFRQVYPQILDAVGGLHALGYVQADLKPDHVFIDLEALPCRVTLIDVGAAVRRPSEARMFTVGYSAPEAINGRAVDERADLYALGALLYFCLTGRGPFEAGDDWGETLHRQFALEPEIPGDTPQLFVTLLRALLHDVPACRPESVREIRQWLQRIWPREPIDDRPDPEPVSFPTVPRGHAEQEFESWLGQLPRPRSGEAPRRARFIMRGEPGIGIGQLSQSLLDIAEVSGWLVDDRGPVVTTLPDRTSHPPIVASGQIRPLLGAVDGIRIELVRSFAPVTNVGVSLRAASESDLEDSTVSFQAVRSVDLSPMSRVQLVALAGLRWESQLLCTELARLSLGSPGLLVALAPRVRAICDLLNATSLDGLHDRSFESGDPPREWIAWCCNLLEPLPTRAREDIVGRAVHGLVRDSLATPPRPHAGLYPLIERGLLTAEGALASPLWARAIVAASPALAREIAAAHLDAHPGADARARAELALAVGNPDLVVRTVPDALTRLVDDGRLVDAGDLLAASANMLPEDHLPRFLERTDLPTVTAVVTTWNPEAWFETTVLERMEDWAKERDVPTREAIRILGWLGQNPGDGTADREAIDCAPSDAQVRKSWVRALTRNRNVRSEGLERAAGIIPDDTLRLIIAFRDVLADPAEFRFELPAGWRDPEDLPRGLLPAALAREHLTAAALLALETEQYDTCARRIDAVEACTPDRMASTTALRVDQARGAIAFETGTQGDCVRASRASLRSTGALSLPSALINVAYAEFEHGRLGSALGAVNAAENLLRTTSPSHAVGVLRSRARAQAGVAWIRSRLGFLDSLPTESLDATAGDARPIWLDALAYVRIAQGAREAGRGLYRRLVDAEDSPPEDAIERLVDWLFLEFDLGDLEFATRIASELRDRAEQARGRILTKVRLASCTLELALEESLDPELEELILAGEGEIAESEAHLYRWRSVRNHAVFLERSGRDAEAVREWDRAHRVLQQLLASCRTSRETQVVRRTPAIEAFFREYHR